jgi:hypothetical protein
MGDFIRSGQCLVPLVHSYWLNCFDGGEWFLCSPYVGQTLECNSRQNSQCSVLSHG